MMIIDITYRINLQMSESLLNFFISTNTWIKNESTNKQEVKKKFLK